jgi:hypothetical protein
VHSNVGGGVDDQGIADITLAWMMAQLQGMITFDEKYIAFQYELTRAWETNKFGQEREWSLGISSPLLSLHNKKPILTPQPKKA